MDTMTLTLLDTLATLICIGFICLLFAIVHREVSAWLRRRRGAQDIRDWTSGYDDHLRRPR